MGIFGFYKRKVDSSGTKIKKQKSNQSIFTVYIFTASVNEERGKQYLNIYYSIFYKMWLL